MSAAAFTVLPWLEDDETLYSFCGHVHHLHRPRSAAQSAETLLRAAHASRQHDMPSTPVALLDFLRGQYTDEVEAMRRHTIAGYYWPFMVDERRRQVGRAWASGEPVKGLRVMGASTRCITVRHPLKWCPFCAVADRERFGRSYWHVHHQSPTTFECSSHGAPLKDAGLGGKTWKLPGSACDEPLCTTSDVTRTLAAIGEAIGGFDVIDRQALREAAIDRLADLGVLHSRHSAVHERLAMWFRRTPTGQWLRRAPSGLDALADGEWVARMLWRHPNAHPARWTVLWSAMAWNSPTEASQRFAMACFGLRCAPNGLPTDAEIAWPRAEAPEGFRDAAQRCLSYKALCETLDATRADVIRWFEAYPSLRETWRASMLAQRRTGSRTDAERLGGAGSTRRSGHRQAN